MGFFSNMIGGVFGAGAGVSGAHNAHLAELAVKDMSVEVKKKVAEKVINMGAIASANRVSSEDFCDMFNNKDRICQLNIIALALEELNIHQLPNDSWMPVKNPFTLAVSQEDLEVNSVYLLKKHGIKCQITAEKIDLKGWASL